MEKRWRGLGRWNETKKTGLSTSLLLRACFALLLLNFLHFKDVLTVKPIWSRYGQAVFPILSEDGIDRHYLFNHLPAIDADRVI